MMLYSELLTDMRYELDDSDSTRWPDDALMSFVKRANRRIHDILVKNFIEFAQTSVEISVISGTESYDLPSDFAIPVGLYNLTTRVKYTHIFKDSGLRVKAGVTSQYWSIIGDKVYLDGAPTEDATLTLVYYPVADNTITTASDVPYDDKLYDSTLMYASLLAKNVDEMEIGVDVSMLQDIETTLVNMYGRLDPDCQGLEGDTVMFP